MNSGLVNAPFIVKLIAPIARQRADSLSFQGFLAEKTVKSPRKRAR
jgi:hypothetical protein